MSADLVERFRSMTPTDQRRVEIAAAAFLCVYANTNTHSKEAKVLKAAIELVDSEKPLSQMEAKR